MSDAPFPDDMLPSIEKFLAEDTAPPGLDSYPAVFASDRFYPLQRRRELERMMRLARSYKPQTIMEIGADKGGGVYHWCQCLPTVRYVIACEIRGTPYAAAMERRFPDIKFLWLPCSSYAESTVKVVRRFLWEVEREIDVLFIDGDKSEFSRDLALYEPLVESPGLILMHDVGDPGPREAYERAGWTKKIVDRDEWRDLSPDDQTPYANWLRTWKGGSCTVGVWRKL